MISSCKPELRSSKSWLFLREQSECTFENGKPAAQINCPLIEPGPFQWPIPLSAKRIPLRLKHTKSVVTLQNSAQLPGRIAEQMMKHAVVSSAAAFKTKAAE